MLFDTAGVFHVPPTAGRPALNGQAHLLQTEKSRTARMFLPQVSAVPARCPSAGVDFPPPAQVSQSGARQHRVHTTEHKSSPQFPFTPELVLSGETVLLDDPEADREVTAALAALTFRYATGSVRPGDAEPLEDRDE